MKINNIILFLGIITIFTISCHKKPNNKNNFGIVKLYFKEIPVNSKLEFEDGKYVSSGTHELECYSEDLVPFLWIPTNRKADSLQIEKVNETIEIVQKYKAVDNLTYLLKAGDEVEVTFEEKIPIYRLLNRDSKKYDLNFDVLVREKILNGDISSMTKVDNNMWVLTESPKDFNEIGIKKYQNYQKQKSLEELKKEEEILDSVYNISEISNEYYRYFKNRIKYKTALLLIDELENKEINTLVKNDSLLKFLFYRNFLQGYSKSRIEPNFIYNDKIDFKKVYDSINKSNLLTYKEKLYLSSHYLETIINDNYSNTEVIEYFDKFINSYHQENNVINYFKNNFNLQQDLNSLTELVGLNGSKYNLEDVIKKHSGKIIYVDFWASWCMPCRRTMESSKVLRDYYKDKNVVFIYLAINDKIDSWKIANKEDDLNNYKETYFITNSKNSKLIDELGINSIPRFLLYDKTGKLVNDNAPRPDSKEIKNEINKYLND